jgi:hypothetical protein
MMDCIVHVPSQQDIALNVVRRRSEKHATRSADSSRSRSSIGRIVHQALQAGSMSDHEHDACPYMFHSSLRLYAMVQKPIDVPSAASRTNYCSDMQMICHRTDRERFVCTYLSPLDAAMGSRSLRDDDAHFWPIDFRCVDTRHFMEQEGALTVSVNYAWAADRNRLVVAKRGHPVMVYTGDSFDIPHERRNHFHIRFSDRVVDRLDSAFNRAGLSNFADTLDEMGNWSAEQIADAEEQAWARMPATVHVDELRKTSMDQYAIYDPVSGDWVFTDFD